MQSHFEFHTHDVNILNGEAKNTNLNGAALSNYESLEKPVVHKKKKKAAEFVE